MNHPIPGVSPPLRHHVSQSSSAKLAKIGSSRKPGACNFSESVKFVA